MTMLLPLTSLNPARFETTSILKKVASAGRLLAELKGISASIPNQAILINTLALQEAKDSSEIESIITTQDELFRDSLFPGLDGSPSAKEVRRYGQALRVGFDLVQSQGLLTNNHILEIQATLEQNSAGFRRLPGTALKNTLGETIYTPPQDPAEILALMADLEVFVNDLDVFEADPLVKMAILHHQFESIHPFYDGNGRTGRILNVLYLVQQGLLDIPILYLSRYLVRTKPEYYRLLQGVRDRTGWEDWTLYLLTAVEETARQTIVTVAQIQTAQLDYKRRIRAEYKFYSQDLINNLFMHPYTKTEFMEQDLTVSRVTATKYLEALTAGGFLEKKRLGRSNYYINVALYRLLTQEGG
jgi:Fic family protein